MSWTVYVARCEDGTLYTGVTTDLERRLAEHNAGRGGAYTRSRLPVSLVYSEPVDDRSRALQREYAIKRLAKAEKEALAAPGQTTGYEVRRSTPAWTEEVADRRSDPL